MLTGYSLRIAYRAALRTGTVLSSLATTDTMDAIIAVPHRDIRLSIARLLVDHVMLLHTRPSLNG